MIFLLLLLSAYAVAADPARYTVHHRLAHPTLPPIPYVQCGSIHLDTSLSPSFLPVDNPPMVPDALTQLPSESLYYQIALQRGDEDEAAWDFTSVKACHIPSVTSQTIILHTHNANPFNLDYYLWPIPSDGSCAQSSSSLFSTLAHNLRGLNTTIVVTSSHPPPLPELRKPQPLMPTGEPIKPVLEKSFIQKYWMYIGAIFVAFLLAGGGEEGPRKQAQA